MSVRHSLELSVIGNSNINALIDRNGCIVWSCFPRMDGDPIFCSLLRNRDDLGFWKIELDNVDPTKTNHGYVGNKPIVRTTLTDQDGNSIEIIDFAPRYSLFHRFYRPNTIVRCVRPLAGKPKISIRLHPTFAYGWGAPERTRGSNHIRYLLANQTLRLTTNVSITYIMNEAKFLLEEPVYLIMMPDESLTISPGEYFADSLEKTSAYWDSWFASLRLPLDYQDEVMRASVILKLCSWEETGGIISSMTTSIATSPEGQTGSLRDLRHCHLRDANVIVRAMADLNITSMMDGLRKFMVNAKTNHPDSQQHVYGIGLENRLVDKTIHRLAGYRGMSTVGVGTPEYRRRSIEAPSLCILSFSKMFYDRRCSLITTDDFYTELESFGDQCLEQYRTSDGNLSADRQSIIGAQKDLIGVEPIGGLIPVIQNWAACARLGSISSRAGKPERAQYWNHQADLLRGSIILSFFNESTKAFTLRLGDPSFDSSILALWKYDFLPVDDDKMMSTLDFVNSRLVTPDGVKHAPTDKTLDYAATFAWIKIQARLGHVEKAKALFDKVLKTGRKTGATLSEKWDPATGEMWGNFPSAVAMASLIDCATELGASWITAA